MSRRALREYSVAAGRMPSWEAWESRAESVPLITHQQRGRGAMAPAQTLHVSLPDTWNQPPSGGCSPSLRGHHPCQVPTVSHRSWVTVLRCIPVLVFPIIVLARPPTTLAPLRKPFRL